MLNRKFYAVFIAVLIFLTSILTSNAFALSITSEELLMTGVTYKHIEMLADSGWQDIHVVTADLKEPHLAFKVLSDSRGGSYLLNTYEMAKEADAVAAINADFFAAKKGQSGRGSAVGMEISDGELKTTPSVAEKMNVFLEMQDGSFVMDSFVFDIKVIAPNGKSQKIRHINKYDDRTEICMYTSKWGEYSPGSEGGIIEVLVEDGKVIEKYTEHEGIEITENAFVLSSHLSFNTFLLDNFEVGDEVEIEISSTPDIEQIKNAVGGGGILVKDGEPQTEFSHNITGVHPRSAVGIDESGKIITLVAVDGRRDGAKGMTQAELGEFMASLGCRYALNLDGGGSTLLSAKKEEGHTILNTPSDNYKRPVTNSIGIVAGEELGQTSNIKIKASENVFSGMKTELNIAGYDKYYRKTEDISPEKVSFKVLTSNGYMDGNEFCGTAPGIAKISATYGNATCNIEINVLEKPTKLRFGTKNIELKKGESYTPELIAYDKDGYSASVMLKDVDFNISGTNAVIENGIITAKSQGTAILSASLGNLTAYASVCVDGASGSNIPEDISIADYKNTSVEISGQESFRFTVFGNVKTPETLIDYIALNKAMSSLKGKAILHSFLGDVNMDLIGDVAEKSFLSKGYSSFDYNGSTFVTINNEKGSIFESDKTQWASLESTIKNAKGGNIFVFVDDISLSSLDIEKKVLKSMLSDAATEGSNVFVFGRGAKNNAEAIDGVRYIETAGIFDKLGTKEDSDDIRDIKYILVTVNGKNVTFEEKSILE